MSNYNSSFLLFPKYKFKSVVINETVKNSENWLDSIISAASDKQTVQDGFKISDFGETGLRNIPWLPKI